MIHNHDTQSPVKHKSYITSLSQDEVPVVQDISLGYSSLELQAMLENFELDGEPSDG